MVIDSNSFTAVFEPDCKDHAEFSPVKCWIENGKGAIVFGGTKYKNELGFRRMRLVRYMAETGLAISIRDDVVDEIEKFVIAKTSGTGCNDQHIIALLAAARCGLLCSLDKKSFSYIKNKKFYPKDAVRVRIYSSSKNAGLLVKIACDSFSNVSG